MTLTKQFSFSPVSAIQAQNSGTVSVDFIKELPKTATGAVGSITFGNLSQTGTLALDMYLGIESSVASSTAWQFFAATSLNAQSTTGLAFTSLNSGQGLPMLPYCRMKISGKAGGVAQSVFENIVAKLTVD